MARGQSRTSASANLRSTSTWSNTFNIKLPACPPIQQNMSPKRCAHFYNMRAIVATSRSTSPPQFRRSRIGRWPRFLARLRRITCRHSWHTATVLVLSAVGITPSCCCLRDLGCALAKSHFSSSTTLTGKPLPCVRSKGGRISRLPLPLEVGEAIAAYLRTGRPVSTGRRVFLRALAPIRGFARQVTVLSVVRQAMVRAGIDPPRKGAHQFRHALACEMLRRGASLPEIGQILGHRSPQTTAIYAKVDLASLHTLALPWPGGV
jgi:Phage integrase family